MEDFSETTRPGAFVTSRILWLAHLPVWMQWWRPQALLYFRRQRDLWMKLLINLKSKISAQKAPSCFAKDFLEEVSPSQDFSDEQIAFLAGSKFACSVCSVAPRYGNLLTSILISHD